MPTAVRRIDSHARSVGEVLRSPLSYRVPVYQRDFAWTDEEIETIWEDLLRSFEEDQGEYFLGAIVLSRVDDEKVREVVDGQQRLVALSMLFGIISREWGRRDEENRMLGVFRDYLGTEDRRTGDTNPKLTLNANNDFTFHKIVVQGKQLGSSERQTLNYSNRLIATAYDRLRKQFENWLKGQHDQESALIDVEEYLANNTNLIVIDVDNDADAFTIFETLNGRGLDLAVSDLVKNYLFSKSAGRINQFQSAWGEIALLVGSEHVTQFLRHYWLSRYTGVVRERDLYRALRQEVRGVTKARKTMEELRGSSSLYAALLNPENPAWSQHTPDARSYLEALITFSVTQYRPVALAAMETLDHSAVTEILRVLMITSFRYTVVSGLGTGNLERIYAAAALSIRNGGCHSAKQLFSQLRQIYVDDDKFCADFSSSSFSKAPIARYVLGQINDHMEGDPEHTVAESSGRITLEHIMPKHRGSEWASVNDEKAEQAVDQIGNLTLLEKGKNRGIANAGFSTKRKKAFDQSSLCLNKQLVNRSSWTVASIKQRSADLAKIAANIWRLDF